MRGQKIGQHARMMRIQMLDQDECHAGVGRHVIQEGSERCKSAGRCADTHDQSKLWPPWWRSVAIRCHLGVPIPRRERLGRVGNQHYTPSTRRLDVVSEPRVRAGPDPTCKTVPGSWRGKLTPSGPTDCVAEVERCKSTSPRADLDRIEWKVRNLTDHRTQPAGRRSLRSVRVRRRDRGRAAPTGVVAASRNVDDAFERP
jgi:hypothetical protein